jgi:hypothetical protein
MPIPFAARFGEFRLVAVSVVPPGSVTFPSRKIWASPPRVPEPLAYRAATLFQPAAGPLRRLPPSMPMPRGAPVAPMSKKSPLIAATAPTRLACVVSATVEPTVPGLRYFGLSVGSDRSAVRMSPWFGPPVVKSLRVRPGASWVVANTPAPAGRRFDRRSAVRLP